MGTTVTHKPTVVALGGNAFAGPDGALSVPRERELAAEVVNRLRPLFKAAGGVVVTHGSGPQVGQQLLRVEVAGEHAYRLPLDSCVAATQGELGDVLATALRQALLERGEERLVAAVLSHVVVDRNASAFRAPSKPVGSFLDKGRSKVVQRAKGRVGVDCAGRGLHRLVPPPEPQEILEADVIRALLGLGAVVEACVRFVSAPGRRAVICDSASVERALEGEAGTQVVFE
jgi:carbamate kinase